MRDRHLPRQRGITACLGCRQTRHVGAARMTPSGTWPGSGGWRPGDPYQRRCNPESAFSTAEIRKGDIDLVLRDEKGVLAGADASVERRCERVRMGNERMTRHFGSN